MAYETNTNCLQKSSKEFNKAICELKCPREVRGGCRAYNRNLFRTHHMSNEEMPLIILERNCPKLIDDHRPYNEVNYDKAFNFIRCKECAERKRNNHCRYVLSPKISTALISDTIRYSEFSGCTTVVAPNNLTFDLKMSNAGEQSLFDVRAIQFLLWDNRGNDKREICDVKVRYRLLVSDYAGDLAADENGEVVPTDKGQTVRWQVLYDTLRSGQNGWQVFHLERTVRIRYIRLHLISSDDEDNRCNIVRLGAYAHELVGYPYYNFLPTLEKQIEVPDEMAVEAAAEKPVDEIKGAPNTAAKFPIALQATINDRRNEIVEIYTKRRVKMDTASRVATELMKNLVDDLGIVINDLKLHDRRVEKVTSEIHRKLNRQLRWQSGLSVISIGLLILAFIQILCESFS